MANQADVYVKNLYFESVQVVRNDPSGNPDYEKAITLNGEEKIYLASPDVTLTISAPEGSETKNTPIRVLSDVDHTLVNSRTNSNWTFKIIPNELPPDTPEAVNITLGDDEPE